MILNVEVRKQGDGFVLLEQGASDHIDTGHGVEREMHKGATVFQGSRGELENWLADRGIPSADVSRALDEAKENSGPLLEVGADYSEAEKFPRL